MRYVLKEAGAPSQKRQPKSTWIPASGLAPRNTRWLWWPRIPFGHLSIVAGRGGSGKGLFCADIVSRLTMGRVLPGKEHDEIEPKKVVWVETEDDFRETMVPRLIAAQSDLENIMLLKPREFFNITSAFMLEMNVGLIVLSPLVSCLEGIADTNKESEVRDHLEVLCENYMGTEIALLGLMHLNKKVDLAAIERILGSSAFANFARSVLFCTEDQDQPGKKRLSHQKHNLSQKANDLVFTPTPTRTERDQYVKVVWETPEFNVDLDAGLDKKDQTGKSKPGDPSKSHKGSALEWLTDYLRNCEFYRAFKGTIMAEARRCKHTRDAIEKARIRAGDFIVVEEREISKGKKATYWSLKVNGHASVEPAEEDQNATP